MSPDRGSQSNRLESTARILDIKRLKQWVAGTLPSSYYLREVIMMEPDELSIEEYLAKIPLWLKLLGLDTRK